ncbi:hypothetical protein [Bordetella trematum]|uniref:hypothetical protein n=1 Tax=Bordetella trematum TaxID=123899 RepID=UPI000470DFA0|nr:hypothetical protein [Bordetella trematum]
MNTYSEHAVRKFHAAYQEGSFDQDDVALLIVVSRDYTKKGGVLRELGDFLAHPDRKTKGLVIDEIQRVAPQFDDFLIHDYEGLKNGLEYDPDMAPIFTGIKREALASELSKLFALAQIKDTAVDEDSCSFREFVACVILLLEPCLIYVNQQTLKVDVTYGHSITATVSYESHMYKNHFAKLTILSLPNVNLSWLPLHHTVPVTGMIARRDKHGGLIGITRENDLRAGFIERDDFESGEIYPLNPPNQWHSR